MNLILAIASELNVPNEWVIIDRAQAGLVWFSVKGQRWTAKVTKHERLKKHSIRADFH